MTYMIGGSAVDLSAFSTLTDKPNQLGAIAWSAEVAVQGKVKMTYDLYKTNADGVETNETASAPKTLSHSNTIGITIPDVSNLETAMLKCNEVDFSNLQQYKSLPQEGSINCSLEVFESTHGVSVPFVLDKDSSGERIGESFDLLSIFTCCANLPINKEPHDTSVGAMNPQYISVAQSNERNSTLLISRPCMDSKGEKLGSAP